MKHGSWILAVLLGAGPASGADLALRLRSAPDAGVVVVSLYDSPLTFSELRDPVRSERFELSGTGPYRVQDVPAGELAVAVHLDENGNNRLDRNLFGIPREPVGFSNGYAPKGPPVYARASIELGTDSNRELEIALRRPLGNRGRIAAGVGVIGRSNPYRGGDGLVLRAIPAITYIGERVQIFGPAMRVGLVSDERSSLAATGRYSIGPYEEDDSPVLRGLGDREDTILAGISVSRRFSHGVELGAGYEHDVLDRIGGGMAKVSLQRSFPVGILNLSPSMGVKWMSEEFSNHYYGVPEGQATETRAAYRLGDTVQPEVGLGARIELTSSWGMILNLSLERLDEDVRDSPIVDADWVMSGFGALSYSF